MILCQYLQKVYVYHWIKHDIHPYHTTVNNKDQQISRSKRSDMELKAGYASPR